MYKGLKIVKIKGDVSLVRTDSWFYNHLPPQQRALHHGSFMSSQSVKSFPKPSWPQAKPFPPIPQVQNLRTVAFLCESQEDFFHYYNLQKFFTDLWDHFPTNNGWFLHVLNQNSPRNILNSSIFLDHVIFMTKVKLRPVQINLTDLF